MSEVKDYRVSVKVRNNRILKAIEAVGGSPGQKWCAENGLGYVRTNNLINMTASPLNSDGTLCDCAIRLCEVTGKIPDDLWSSEQLYPLEKNFSDIEMDQEQVMALLPEGERYALPDRSIDQKQMAQLIDTALNSLSQREEEIIRLRFHSDLTLEDVSKRLGVTRERVRQIEQKALRKLRSPARVGLYVDCLDNVPNDKRDEYKEAARKFMGDSK